MANFALAYCCLRLHTVGMSLEQRVEPAAIGMRHLGGWGMHLAPDIIAQDVLVDYDSVRQNLGVQPRERLHLFFDIDRTLRVTDGKTLVPPIPQHLRQYRDSGGITSISLTSNNRWDSEETLDGFAAEIGPDVRRFSPANMGGLRKQDSAFFRGVISKLRITAGDPILVVGDKVLKDIASVRALRAQGDEMTFISLSKERLREGRRARTYR